MPNFLFLPIIRDKKHFQKLHRQDPPHQGEARREAEAEPADPQVDLREERQHDQIQS